MNKALPQKHLLTAILFALVALTAASMANNPSLHFIKSAHAQDRDQTRDRDQLQIQDRDQERIYGSQLMTQQERNEYREKMRSMRTQQERDAFRLEHHQRMQERARAQGLQLPDMPPQDGNGMGPGERRGGGPGGGGRGR